MTVSTKALAVLVVVGETVTVVVFSQPAKLETIITRTSMTPTNKGAFLSKLFIT
jgi:hypothetical protein